MYTNPRNVVVFVDGVFKEVHCGLITDPAAPVERRDFRVLPTGVEWESDGELLHYLGTFQLTSGRLVFHLFEIGRGN